MKKNFLYKLFFKYIPQLLSVILHPLLMPTLGMYIILSSSGTSAYVLDFQDKYFILTLVAAFTCVIPLAFLPFYYYFKISTSLVLQARQHRIIPLIVTFILFYFCFMIFRIKGAPHIIQSFLLASSIAVFCNLLISFRWQISAHMIGIGGIIGLVLALDLLYHIEIISYLMVLLLLGGLIGFARLSLDAHTPKQVYSGLALGLLVMMLVIFLY